MTSHQRTIELIKEAQNGSDAAKAELVSANLPLIKSIVRRYKYKQVEYDDLIELGTLGLVKAINNFDTSYEVRFSTYAVPMIAGEIKRFIRDDGAIKVSRSMKATSQKIGTFIDSFRQEKSRDPSVGEIAAEFEMSPQEIVFIMDSSKYPVSIYAENDEDGLPLVDRLQSSYKLDDAIDKHILKSLVEELDERDKKIIMLRYYHDLTQSEIAKMLNVSQVQVSRLESKIIEKFRKELL